MDFYCIPDEVIAQLHKEADIIERVLLTPTLDELQQWMLNEYRVSQPLTVCKEV